ncbi:hypothetical protein Tco_1053315, partial [Tanacetum coccineum]
MHHLFPRVITRIEGWKGQFFFVQSSIVPAEYPQLLLEQNKWDSKSYKDKLPPNIKENPMFQRLGRYPTSVRVFRDPIRFLASDVLLCRSRPRLGVVTDWYPECQGYSDRLPILVILFGAIPAIIPVILEVPTKVPIVHADPLVAPEVRAVSVTLPTGVLDLVGYSSSDSDPSEDSLPPTPELPLVSPFLCSDDSKMDSESEPVEERPERHESLIVHDFPVALVIAPPGICQWPTILIRPGEAIPFGRPYRTHPNRPHKLLTIRKRVGPFPTRRLAWRRVSHYLPDRHSSPDFTSDSSSSGSSLDSLSDTSLGPPSDSLSAPLSTPYPPTTSESSLDSFSERSLDSALLSAGPSRKRCRSPTTLVPSSTPIGAADAEAVVDLGIGDGVHTRDGIGMGVEISASDIREDGEEFEAEASAGGTMEMVVDPLVTGGISESTRGDVPDLEGTLYDIVHYMLEVPLDRITEFETAQRQLEAGKLMASGERAGLTDRIRRLGLENLKVRALLCIERDRVDSLRRHMALSQEEFCRIRRDHDDARRRLRRLESFDMTITRSGMTPEAIEELIAQRVAEALANYEATRAANALEAESQSQNGNDGNNGNGENGNGNHGDRRNNGNENPNENSRGLIRWFEKMETTFYISNCPEVYQVKYATCTLLDSALTWWNSHKRTVGVDAAFAMTWRDLMKLMTKV